MTPLLILTGLPATGKTTLARALVATSGWALLSKDELKEPLMAALSALNAGHSRQLSDASFQLLFTLLPPLLASSGGVVLEGNFRSGEHEAALAGACAARPVLQVLCRVDEPRRQQRVGARAATGGRDPHHARAAQQAHRPECDRFLDLPGARIQLAGDAPLDENLTAIRCAARAVGIFV